MKQVADSCFIYRSIETALMQEVLGQLDLIISQEVQSELYKRTSDRFESDKKEFEKKIKDNSEYEFLKDHLESLDSIEQHIRLFTSEIESHNERLDINEQIRKHDGPSNLKSLAEEDASCFLLHKNIEAEKIITDDLEAYNEFIKELGSDKLYCLAEVIINEFPESRKNKKLVKLLYDEYIDKEKKNAAETLLEQIIVEDYLYGNAVT